MFNLSTEKMLQITRVIIPKQDFIKGKIKVIVVESYLEDIVVTEGPRHKRM